MGTQKYLNRAAKKTERERESESAKLFRELEDFYRENPKSSPAVRRQVDKIRGECDEVMELLQADFDRQHETTTCVYLRREIDFVKGFLPGYVPPAAQPAEKKPFRRVREGLAALFSKKNV